MAETGHAAAGSTFRVLERLTAGQDVKHWEMGMIQVRFGRGLVRTGILATLVLTAGLLPGCLIRSRSNQTATGATLAAADVRSIKAGETTGNQLVESFGAPTERMDRPDGSATWKWCKTETRKSSGSVFLVLGSSSTKSTTACTVVDLKDGVVTQVRSE